MVSGKINALFFPAILLLLLLSCSKQPKVFESNCNDGISFKKVEFTELVSHLKNYNGQYVEVTGKYVEGVEQSALLNDSLLPITPLKKRCGLILARNAHYT